MNTQTPAATLRDRTIETVYETENVNEDGRAVLVIRASHYKPRRGFMLSVRRQRRDAIAVREAFSFGEPDPIPSEIDTVARYSENALRAAHAGYIERHNLTDPRVLADLLTWAEGAK